MLPALFAVLSFLATASAQCTVAGTTRVDSATCSTWIGNGFCTSTFYTLAQAVFTEYFLKRLASLLLSSLSQLYCGTACGLCTGTPTTTCVNANANCASWVANGFCSNSFYSTAQKTEYCAQSCGLCSSTRTPPVTACAAAYDATGAVTSIIGVSPLTSPYPIGLDFMGTTINNVYVNTGCTLTLSANPTDATGGSAYTGTSAFVTITTAADTTAQSAGCTCP